MDLDFYTNSVLVDKKKKYANFTLTEIGGPDEIVAWRERQAAKEATYNLRLGAREERRAMFEELTGQKVASPNLSTASWQEKELFAKFERARLRKLEDKVLRFPSFDDKRPPVKSSCFSRIKNYFKRIWQSANF